MKASDDRTTRPSQCRDDAEFLDALKTLDERCTPEAERHVDG